MLLKYFENLDDLFKQKVCPNLYGISKDPILLNFILVLDYRCIKCWLKFNFFDWCKSCKLKHFQFNYEEFLSENNEINNLLKDNYCDSKEPEELIKWIPYWLYF
ncbi:hypothetical protein C1645_752430 [Glomus cerebriforme]|uniref:Uncharacterized protein n=1 Tax=Glomus cerebriforme TaxID=658196 RepID=A0A397TLN9_9GLOM|nr:hypothetical protein C1645_752430 [Glomus cerebriforme]